MQMQLRSFSPKAFPSALPGKGDAKTRSLTGALGVRLFAEGRHLLDGTGGNWRANLGHGDPCIADSIAHAADLPLSDRLHDQLRDLTARLSALAGPCSHPVFAETGSHALAKALKIAPAYHRARKYHGRNIIITANQALGATGRLHLAGEIFPGSHFLAAGRTFGEIEDLISLHGASSIAALLIEPLGASAGLAAPTAEFCRAVTARCRRDGILVICDESLSGLGRLGTRTASQRLGITPDILVLGDSLTNGELPLGAALCGDQLVAALLNAGSRRRTAATLHVGMEWNPDRATTAAALACLKRHEELGLAARVMELESYWSECLHSLAGAPIVTAVRTAGLTAAVELTPRPGAAGSRGQRLFQRCLEYGLLIHVTDDMAMLSPPLITTHDQVDDMVEKLSAALRKLA